jgi:chromosome segregation ATPase
MVRLNSKAQQCRDIRVLQSKHSTQEIKSALKELGDYVESSERRLDRRIDNLANTVEEQATDIQSARTRVEWMRADLNHVEHDQAVIKRQYKAIADSLSEVKATQINCLQVAGLFAATALIAALLLGTGLSDRIERIENYLGENNEESF